MAIGLPTWAHPGRRNGTRLKVNAELDVDRSLRCRSSRSCGRRLASPPWKEERGNICHKDQVHSLLHRIGTLLDNESGEFSALQNGTATLFVCNCMWYPWSGTKHRTFSHVIDRCEYNQQTWRAHKHGVDGLQVFDTRPLYTPQTKNLKKKTIIKNPFCNRKTGWRAEKDLQTQIRTPYRMKSWSSKWQYPISFNQELSSAQDKKNRNKEARFTNIGLIRGQLAVSRDSQLFEVGFNGSTMIIQVNYVSLITQKRLLESSNFQLSVGLIIQFSTFWRIFASRGRLLFPPKRKLVSPVKKNNSWHCAW